MQTLPAAQAPGALAVGLVSPAAPQDPPGLLSWVRDLHAGHQHKPTLCCKHRSPGWKDSSHPYSPCAPQRARLNLSSPEKQEPPGEIIERAIRERASPRSGNNWDPGILLHFIFFWVERRCFPQQWYIYTFEEFWKTFKVVLKQSKSLFARCTESRPRTDTWVPNSPSQAFGNQQQNGEFYRALSTGRVLILQ